MAPVSRTVKRLSASIVFGAIALLLLDNIRLAAKRFNLQLPSLETPLAVIELAANAVYKAGAPRRGFETTKYPVCNSAKDCLAHHQGSNPRQRRDSMCSELLSGRFLQSRWMMPSLSCGPDVFQVNSSAGVSYKERLDYFFQHMNNAEAHHLVLPGDEAWAAFKRTGVSDQKNEHFEVSNSQARIKKGSTVVRCGTLERSVMQRYCDTRNIAIKVGKVPLKTAVRSELDLNPPFGTLKGTATCNEWNWFGPGFGGGAAKWLVQGLDVNADENIECSAWIETPLFFISRWDTTNPYQFHQDAMNTFLVHSLLGLEVNDTQVVILDSRSVDGPFTTAWSHIFSNSHRLLDIRQLVSGVSSQLHLGEDATICVRRAIWGVHGGVSPVSMGGLSEDTCQNSPLLLAFRDFMLSRLAIAARSLAQVPKHLRFPSEAKKWFSNIPFLSSKAKTTRDTLTITFSSRRQPATNEQPPMDLGLKSQQIHGLCQTDVRPTPFWRSQPSVVLRRILNEEEVVVGIQSAAEKWLVQRKAEGSIPPNFAVEMRAVDFAQLSFIEQVSVSQGTDILIGPHGAGFAHLLYLRKNPMAGVIELSPVERRVNNMQFHNLAKRLGHAYRRVNYNGDSTKEDGVEGRTVNGAELKALDEAVWDMLDTVSKEHCNK